MKPDIYKILPLNDKAKITEKNPFFVNKAIEIINDWNKGKNIFELTTSGSTGIPKKIKFSREQIIESATQTGKYFGLRPNDNIFSALSSSYVAGFMMIMRALVLNLNLFSAAPSKNPIKNLDKNIKIHFAAFVPMQLHAMIKNNNLNRILGQQTKAVILGGGDISELQMKKFEQLKVPLFHTFGMTETLTHFAIRRLNGATKTNYFNVFENTQIKQDKDECLVVKSKITNNKWLKTNDIVKIVAKNKFQWIGRFDNIINSGGYKIQIEATEKKIEKILSSSFDYNINFVLYPQLDQNLGHKICLVVEHEEFSDNVKNKFTTQLKEKLHKYEIPKKIHFVNKLEYLSNNKPNRLFYSNI